MSKSLQTLKTNITKGSQRLSKTTVKNIVNAGEFEKISRFLIKPTEKMLTMNFSELYCLIHWNSHKQNFDELFISSI